MKFKINDAVILKEDNLEEGLKAGAVGVVVAEFVDPCEAYEVEICDDEGGTVAQLTLLPSQLSKYE